MPQRRHQRVPCSFSVEFRTPSSFLVAYSINLSRGGIFLETSQHADLEIGDDVRLQLDIPGSDAVEVTGTISWIRVQNTAAEPSGIGVAFSEPGPGLESLIDHLVGQYVGLTIVLLGTDDGERSTLARMVRSFIQTAEVVHAREYPLAQAIIDDDIDLLLIDADPDPAQVLPLIEKVREKSNVSRRRARLPIVVISSKEVIREAARDLGADLAIRRPQRLGTLQKALMGVLSRGVISSFNRHAD